MSRAVRTVVRGACVEPSKIEFRGKVYLARCVRRVGHGGECVPEVPPIVEERDCSLAREIMALEEHLAELVEHHRGTDKVRRRASYWRGR